jgi:integrase/recombinase XerC
MTDMPLATPGQIHGVARIDQLRSIRASNPAAYLVSAFLRRRKPTTLRAYKQDLKALQGFLAVQAPEDAARFVLEGGRGQANAVALEWVASMGLQGLAPATVARRVSTLRSLVKLARILDMVDWEIEIDGPKVQSLRDTRGPGRKGFEAIVLTLDGIPGDRAARNKAIVRLLFDLALRRAEVVSLDLEHLDLEHESVWVLGKSRNERERLTLPQQTIDTLLEWLHYRGWGPGALFTSMNPSGCGDGRLTGRSIGRILGELGLRAGVGHVRPHGLRHASISEALDKSGGDVRAVQRFSRHKDVNMLLIYDDARRDIAGGVARMVAAGVQLPAKARPFPCPPREPQRGDGVQAGGGEHVDSVDPPPDLQADPP